MNLLLRARKSATGPGLYPVDAECLYRTKISITSSLLNSLHVSQESKLVIRPKNLRAYILRSKRFRAVSEKRTRNEKILFYPSCEALRNKTKNTSEAQQNISLVLFSQASESSVNFTGFAQNFGSIIQDSFQTQSYQIGN